MKTFLTKIFDKVYNVIEREVMLKHKIGIKVSGDFLSDEGKKYIDSNSTPKIILENVKKLSDEFEILPSVNVKKIY